MQHDHPPTATLCHGRWGGPYTEESVPIRRVDSPHYRTQSGYGKKLPTDAMIRYRKRWRRVYVCIYSNSGTCYTIINKTPTVIHATNF